MLAALQKKIDSVSINSLTMSHQSLIDCLVQKQWFNPFPKVRYTERPDAAAASVLEGSMVVIIDNSPAAMIIPSGIFDFLQDTNDYYMSPVIGSYMRVIRMAIFAMTMLLIPVWLLLVQNPEFSTNKTIIEEMKSVFSAPMPFSSRLPKNILSHGAI